MGVSAQVAVAVPHILWELQGDEDFAFLMDLDEPTCWPTVFSLFIWHSCLQSHALSKVNSKLFSLLEHFHNKLPGAFSPVRVRKGLCELPCWKNG